MMPYNNVLSYKYLRRIFLVIGSSCNLRCRHCLQNGMVTPYEDVSKEISEEVIDFLCEWSKVVLPACESTGFKVPRLYFWGGEPLLYFSQIKILVERLYNSGFDKAKVHFTIITNGILLTEEMVEFFNQHNFIVGLSCDGPNPLAVRETAYSGKLWDKINDRYICSILTAPNSDLVQSMLYLKKEYGNVDITYNLLLVNWDMPKDIYDFRYEDFVRQVRNIIRYYSHNKIDKAFVSYLGFLIDELGYNKYLPEKYQDEGSSLALGSDGKFYLYRYTDTCVGSIEDSYHDVIERFWKIIEAGRPSGCCQCRYHKMCIMKNIGIALKTDDGVEYVHCKYYKMFYCACMMYKNELKELIINKV